MTLEAMRPAGSSSAISTLSGGGGGPDDGACGSGDAGSCELDVVLGLIGSASIHKEAQRIWDTDVLSNSDTVCTGLKCHCRQVSL